MRKLQHILICDKTAWITDRTTGAGSTGADSAGTCSIGDDPTADAASTGAAKKCPSHCYW